MALTSKLSKRGRIADGETGRGPPRVDGRFFVGRVGGGVIMEDRVVAVVEEPRRIDFLSSL